MRGDRFSFLLAALLASGIYTQAQATPTLIAIGSLNGTTDLSGLTGTLENGLPANLLGGVGSGIAYAGNGSFIALPDRGPNATAYNSGVDDTTSYITRFHALNMSLTAVSGGALPYTLNPVLNSTTQMYSNQPLNYGAAAGLANGAPAQNGAGKYYFTGRSDNFAAGTSTNPNNGRFDPEGVRVSNDGRSVFVSDEYGPYVYQFDRFSGQRIKSFKLPDELAASNLSPVGNTEISGNSTGRVANKGMEGLALTPDGKTLVGIMQAPLAQDSNKVVRIVTIDIATGATRQFAYQLTTGSGVSEIVAINNHEFLIDERDGKGLGDNSTASVKQIFRIDLNNASDISGKSGNLAAFAVNKTLFLDLKSKLVSAGINAKNIPAKIEGMSFGEDILFGGEWVHTLFISNDNDFLSTITDSNHPNGIANPNNFYVFAVSNADLPGFEAQQIAKVSEPETLLLIGGGFGLMRLLQRHRRQQ